MKLKQQPDLKPIMAKEWMMKNWMNYGFETIKSEEKFLALLNILQAHDVTLEDMHDVIGQGYDEFLGIYDLNHVWTTMDDVYKAVMSYNNFFTEKEFCEWMCEMMVELKDEGYEDPVEEIKEWTYSDNFWYVDHPKDTIIKKTEDGYVRIVSY